jgi:hypothetical protein
VARRQQRLEDQAIDRRIRIIERGQVDLGVPECEQLQIREEGIRELSRDRQIHPPRAPCKTTTTVLVVLCRNSC